MIDGRVTEVIFSMLSSCWADCRDARSTGTTCISPELLVVSFGLTVVIVCSACSDVGTGEDGGVITLISGGVVARDIRSVSIRHTQQLRIPWRPNLRSRHLSKVV